MKVTRAQAQANRQHVLAVASEKFRERGYDGIGVAELMQAAGLTHGGFYGQFPSKRALAAEATATAFARSASIWDEALARGGPEGLAQLVRVYLSTAHRDARAIGCPLAALGSDAPREGEAVAEAFAAGMRDRLSVLEALRPGPEARADALAQLAILVGALVLARAVGADPLSDELLEVARVAALTKPPHGAPGGGNQDCHPLNGRD